MDSMVEIFLERADNEIFAAGALKRLSEEEGPKQDFGLPADITFYSSVISHSYYAIFYAAKAVLLAKGIKTSSPDIHKKTLEAFQKELVDTGILDVKLLEIYKKAVVRADALLEIFKDERWKRGNFTYNTIPQANKEPAGESLSNNRIPPICDWWSRGILLCSETTSHWWNSECQKPRAGFAKPNMPPVCDWWFLTFKGFCLEHQESC